MPAKKLANLKELMLQFNLFDEARVELTFSDILNKEKKQIILNQDGGLAIKFGHRKVHHGIPNHGKEDSRKNLPSM